MCHCRMLFVDYNTIVLVVIAAHYLKDRREIVDRDLEDFWDGAGPFDYCRCNIRPPYGPFLERFRKVLLGDASLLARCRFWGWSAWLQFDHILEML